MKQKKTTILVIVLMTLFSNCFANSHNENNALNSDNKTVCYSPKDRQKISKIITSKSKKITALNFNSAEALADIAFIWPIVQTGNLNNESRWVITNYVDHNSSSNAIQDYNCGTNTYDDHKGTDIKLWPFQWTQMDNNHTRVIAAAAGKIIHKVDGNFDKNCSLINGSNWNAIYLEHSDGSVSWYGHLKTGTLTSKNIDDTVLQGEILGNVGSSGYSTAPHLHFEVYDSNGNLIDPFSGSCNDSTSLWQDQEEYSEGKINTIYTHNALPVFSDCYGDENPNIQNQFNPYDLVYFAGYFSNLKTSDTLDYFVYKPSGTLYKSWTKVIPNNYETYRWIYSYSLDGTEGDWKFVVTYKDQTFTRTFNVGGESCSNKISNFPHSESFENDLSNWKQSSFDDLDWTLNTRNTPSSLTGPSLASTGSDYLYIEASGDGIGYPTKQAILTSPCIDLSNNSFVEFSFDYHMYGSTSDFGSLSVELSEDNGITWKSLWHTTGNKGNQWLNHKVYISNSITNNFLIRFNGITGSYWTSDMAIDNLKFSVNLCETAEIWEQSKSDEYVLGDLINYLGELLYVKKTSWGSQWEFLGDCNSSTAAKNVTNFSEDNIELNTSLKVYPTPLKGNLLNVSLDSDTPKNYFISTTSGKIIMEGILTETINLENLASGLYFINIQNKTAKFIKE